MPADETKFGDWFAPETDAAWRAAMGEALALGHSWFGTEHLLVGLLHGSADDPAVRALAAHGMTLDAVRAVLVRELAGPRRPDDETLLALLGIDLAQIRAGVEAAFGPDAIGELYARRRRAGHRLARGPLCGVAMCAPAKLALEQARRASKADHRGLVSSTDLLIGLLAVPDGMAVRLLRGFNVDTGRLAAQLSRRAAAG